MARKSIIPIVEGDSIETLVTPFRSIGDAEGVAIYVYCEDDFDMYVYTSPVEPSHPDVETVAIEDQDGLIGNGGEPTVYQIDQMNLPFSSISLDFAAFFPAETWIYIVMV